MSSVNDNKKILIDIMCKQNDGFNVVHFNARSLSQEKLDFTRCTFEDSAVDVICVSETWFHHDLPDFNISLNGYNLLRNDRNLNRKGGGVAVYCKKSLKFKLIAKSNNCENEYLFTEVSDGMSKILIACVYNPNKSIALDTLFVDLSDFVLNYERILLCGDFNVNILKNEPSSSKLFDQLATAGLCVVNGITPTRYSNNSQPSLLDYFITCDLSHILKFDQADFISDHDLIFCTLDVVMNRPNLGATYEYRDFKTLNVNSLYSDMGSINWNECWFLSTVDNKLDFLNRNLSSLFNMHVPLRSVNVLNSSCPWYNSKVRAAIRKRNKYYAKWRKNLTDTSWRRYKEIRNETTAIIRQAKRWYSYSKLDPSLPTRELWRNLKKFKIHGKESPECEIDLDELNDYFISVGKKTNCAPTLKESSPCATLKEQFQFMTVCEVDVLKALSKIKSNAIGDDGISLKFVRIVIQYIIGPLTHIINHCLTSSCFPAVWKKAIVFPVAKKANAIYAGDYRPISILPTFSKVCENLMATQISSFVQNNRLLSPLQSGFKQSHSCSTAMVKILDDIRISFDNGDLTLLCLLDFSKAFDSVNHKLLCLKLKHYFGFKDSAVKLMASYLGDRTQKVKTSKSTSQSRYVHTGVPQGSILGPLLFSLFVNDVFNVCQYVNVHAYADDIQLYLSSRIGLVEDLCFKINSDLSAISVWANENSLCLNASKSYVLPICNSVVHVDNIPKLWIGTSSLTFMDKVKNLGFILNTKLTCADHINRVVGNIYATLRKLRVSATFTPEKTRRKLVLQLIMPLITYSEVVYSKLDSTSCHKLNVAFNNATRYVYGIGRYDHISAFRSRLLGCCLNSYLSARNCIFLCKLILFRSPPYLTEKLIPVRSRRHNKFIVPKFNYLPSSRLFFINAVKVWNSLPDTVKAGLNRFNFRAQVYNYFKSV